MDLEKPTCKSNWAYWLFGAAIFFIWFSAVFDPMGGLYNLRFLSLFSVLFCMMILTLVRPPRKISLSLPVITILYLAVVMPFYGLLIYLVRGGWAGPFIDTSYLASAVLILTSFIYADSRLVLRGLASMLLVLRMLVATILCVQGSILFSLGDDWFNFFLQRQVAFIGVREYAGFEFPYLYFVASPLLIYLASYDSWRLIKKPSLQSVSMCALTVLTLGLTGTRSHMAIAVLIVPIFFLYYHKKYLMWLLPIILFALIFLFTIIPLDLLAAIFSSQEGSNSFKISMIQNYSNIFDNPISFIFGQGYNAIAWSGDLASMVGQNSGASKSELTYLELIRVYGLIVALPFLWILGLIYFRVIRLSKDYSWLGLAFLISLANASLNPYLFSTNGLLPLGLILSLIYLEEKPTYP